MARLQFRHGRGQQASSGPTTRAGSHRAIGFYRDVLGARFIASFDPPGLAFFDLGGPALLLEAGVPSALLYLRVQDIDDAHRTHSDRGVVFEEGPHLIYRDNDGFFGRPGEQEWLAAFRDSEGNLVALMARRATT